MDEHDSLPKIRNSNQNLKVIGKINDALKNIISANAVDITEYNHLYYVSAKISTSPCGQKLKKQKHFYKKPASQ